MLMKTKFLMTVTTVLAGRTALLPPRVLVCFTHSGKGCWEGWSQRLCWNHGYEDNWPICAMPTNYRVGEGKGQTLWHPITCCCQNKLNPCKTALEMYQLAAQNREIYTKLVLFI